MEKKSTPFADRIREAARKAANKPMTPVGATASMTEQAYVSSTGKAAPTGLGNVQSSRAETMAAQQAIGQQEAVAENVQEAAQDMAVTEAADAAKQADIESDIEIRELQADNDYKNKLDKAMSEISRAQDKKAADLKSLELKAELDNKRLSNKQYKQAVTDVGRRIRLESKESFAVALAEKGFEKAKESAEATSKRKILVEDHNRGKDRQVTMDSLNNALEASRAQAKAQQAQQNVDLFTSAVGAGVDVYGSYKDREDAAKRAREAQKSAKSPEEKARIGREFEIEHGIGLDELGGNA